MVHSYPSDLPKAVADPRVAGRRAGLPQTGQSRACLTLRSTRAPEGEQRRGQLQPGPPGLGGRAAGGEQVDGVLEAVACLFVIPRAGREQPFQVHTDAAVLALPGRIRTGRWRPRR